MRVGSDILWVGGQVILFVAVGAAVATTSGDAPTPAVAVGGVLALGGLIYALAGVNRLGRSMSPYPTPLAQGQLATQGPYRFSRHPIYGGVVLLCTGISLAAWSAPAVALSLVLVPFFLAKSSREERLLAERYPEYAEYASRVRRRLLPWIV